MLLGYLQIMEAFYEGWQDFLYDVYWINWEDLWNV